jgi:hypothetical protein
MELGQIHHGNNSSQQSSAEILEFAPGIKSMALDDFLEDFSGITHEIETNSGGLQSGEIVVSGDMSSCSGDLNPTLLPYSTLRDLTNSATEQIIESHLLELSFLGYPGFSCRSDYAACGVLERGTPISANLKDAMCYESMLYTTNPLIFHRPPSAQERLLAMRRYEPKSSHLNIDLDSEPLKICDDIRALLVYAVTMVKLGNSVMAHEMLLRANTACKHVILNNPGSSIGEMFSNLSLNEIALSRDTHFTPLNEQIRIEQLCVIDFLFQIDTMASIATGNSYVLDELDLPDVFAPPLYIQPKMKFPLPRRFLPTLGRHTIFEGKLYGPSFDDMREMQALHFDLMSDARNAAHTDIQRYKFLRILIKFSKSFRLYQPSPETRNMQTAFHSRTLEYQCNSINFNVLNLEKFAMGESDSGFPRLTTRHSMIALHRCLEPLLMLLYIHFSSAFVDDPTLYQLALNGKAYYTSREILYACMRQLEYIVRQVRDPEEPEELLEAVHYPPEMLESCKDHVGNVMNPTYTTAGFLLQGFLISSAALTVFGQANVLPSYAQNVKKFVKNTILPVFSPVLGLFPGCREYYQTLVYKLAKYPSEYIAS